MLDRKLAQNPAEDLRPPKAWPALPKFLSLEEVDTLIAQPDTKTPRGLRDRAMVELLYATGMRVTELISVRAADLHLDEHYLTCIGKGNKERLIPIGDEATSWIRRYQREGRAHFLKGGRPSARLFLNARGGGLSRVGFWKIPGLRGRRDSAEISRTCCGIRSPRTARSAGRPARHPDDARAHRSVHHADLHACARGAPQDRVRSLSPPGLI
jgi:site-specific recombinase XerD